MLKKVLKTLFPIVWLKKAFLFYNRIRIKTIDKILFPEYTFKQEDFIICRDVAVYDQLHINEGKLSKEIKERLKLWHHWTQDEYLLVFEQPCIIEPKQGWALADGKLIYPSLGFSRAEYVLKPDYFTLNSSKKKTIYLDEVISLRDTGEENYFHFYNDILAKLCFLEEKLNMSKHVPIVISEKLYNKPYFQFFLNNSILLAGRHWIVQTDFYIEAQLTFFCKPLTHRKDYLDKIKNSVRLQHSTTYQPTMIFLTRSPNRLRYIYNMDEVKEVCIQCGIEIVDADDLSLEEQICLFKGVSLIIGIHGAGLTNIIYGESSIKKVIEIFPPESYVPFHYIMLSHMYGYQYDAILGESYIASSSGGFTLNINELKASFGTIVKAFV